MFRDAQEELKRLEEELLEEEEGGEEELDAFEVPCTDQTLIYDAGCVYNTDDTDEDLEEFSEEVLTPKKDSIRGLVIVALLLTIAILGLLTWWVLELRA